MPIFPSGYGALVTAATALDEDDGALWAIDGGVKVVAPSAGRGCLYTAANTGAAYTATRTALVQDFLLTVTANTTITLAGGAIANEMSVWNIILKENATGGFTIAVNSVKWAGGLPTFTTSALASNHCQFVQHGTGDIYGYFGGSSAP